MRPKTLLIAEDEDVNFHLLKELLTDFNFNIVRVTNGKEAVELCKTNRQIDLVLMDIRMPIMDGYEATKQIVEFIPQLPIIAVTASVTGNEKNKVISIGCKAYISKPIDKKLLISVIKEHLQ